MDSFGQCNISSQKSVGDGEGRRSHFIQQTIRMSMSISIYKTITADLIVQNPKVEAVPNVFK